MTIGLPFGAELPPTAVGGCPSALASLKTLETSSSSSLSPPGPFGTTDSPDPPPLESKN